MKKAIENNVCAVRRSAVVFGILLFASTVQAEDKTPDVQALLPLLEKNSIARKVLDVTYSFMNMKVMRRNILLKRMYILYLILKLECHGFFF
jgi:hypothetical protein